MFFSIVIPLYNREELITETLDSVLSQEFEDWECIVIDDHSTDGSAAIVEAISDPRIKLHLRDGEFNSAPVCRNQGLSLSKGDWIIFLDSDDVLSPDCLINRYNHLSETDVDFIVNPGIKFKNFPGDISEYHTFFDTNATSDLNRFLFLQQPWITTGPTWRRAFLINSNIQWNEQCYGWNDWFFNIQTMVEMPTYERVYKPDHFWRIAGERQTIVKSSWTSQKANILAKEWLSLFRKLSSSSFIDDQVYHEIVRIYTSWFINQNHDDTALFFYNEMTTQKTSYDYVTFKELVKTQKKLRLKRKLVNMLKSFYNR